MKNTKEEILMYKKENSTYVYGFQILTFDLRGIPLSNEAIWDAGDNGIPIGQILYIVKFQGQILTKRNRNQI